MTFNVLVGAALLLSVAGCAGVDDEAAPGRADAVTDEETVVRSLLHGHRVRSQDASSLGIRDWDYVVVRRRDASERFVAIGHDVGGRPKLEVLVSVLEDRSAFVVRDPAGEPADVTDAQRDALRLDLQAIAQELRAISGREAREASDDAYRGGTCGLNVVSLGVSTLLTALAGSAGAVFCTARDLSSGPTPACERFWHEIRVTVGTLGSGGRITWERCGDGD